MILLAIPAFAQKGGPSGGGTGGPKVGPPAGGPPVRSLPPSIQPGAQPSEDPSVFFPTAQPLAKPVIVEDEACLPWPIPDVRGNTVSAARLGVPSKARNQFDKACNAYKKKKLTEAEGHARDAIEAYAKYSAAYVMLGQVLQDEQKLDEAREACTEPMREDPGYLPPYLCVAGVLDLQKNWDDLLLWSDRFLGMSPAADLYGRYYKGLAQFHLKELQEAQKSIADAIALDTQHRQPNLNFLLAQIYGEQRDLAGATAQIQQFLKYAGSRQSKDSAKEYLAQLQSQLAAK